MTKGAKWGLIIGGVVVALAAIGGTNQPKKGDQTQQPAAKTGTSKTQAQPEAERFGLKVDQRKAVYKEYLTVIAQIRRAADAAKLPPAEYDKRLAEARSQIAAAHKITPEQVTEVLHEGSKFDWPGADNAQVAVAGSGTGGGQAAGEFKGRLGHDWVKASPAARLEWAERAVISLRKSPNQYLAKELVKCLDNVYDGGDLSRSMAETAAVCMALMTTPKK